LDIERGISEDHLELDLHKKDNDCGTRAILTICEISVSGVLEAYLGTCHVTGPFPLPGVVLIPCFILTLFPPVISILQDLSDV